jgi:hypothetical protein
LVVLTLLPFSTDSELLEMSFNEFLDSISNSSSVHPGKAEQRKPSAFVTFPCSSNPIDKPIVERILLLFINHICVHMFESQASQAAVMQCTQIYIHRMKNRIINLLAVQQVVRNVLRNSAFKNGTGDEWFVPSWMLAYHQHSAHLAAIMQDVLRVFNHRTGVFHITLTNTTVFFTYIHNEY